MRTIRSKALGFTLIELLLVMVIMGLGLTLVGSFSIEWVEKAKVRDERLMLTRWFKEQSNEAFIQSTKLNYLLDGNAIYVLEFDDEKNAPEKKRLIFNTDFIFFQLQAVKINDNGFITPQDITFSIGDRVYKLHVGSVPDV